MGDSWVGQTLSKVEVQKLLGHGGMADVYLGLHTTLKRPVAVKILHAHLMENANLLSRFRSEAQAVATMRHPNIVQVLDFDIAYDRPYIVMELLEGITLRDYLQQHHDNETRISPAAILHIIGSLARALDYAHARGIIHRDIKPANIMLRHEGSNLNAPGAWPSHVDVVLTDFGIARITDSASHTASGTIVGTPAYMSPEQVRAELVDARSDIYSLGIVLYEMLSGELPFDTDSQAALLIKQISETPAPVQGASPAIQRILDRVLAKTPDQRYDKASELADELQKALAAGGAIQPDSRPARDGLRSGVGAESIVLPRNVQSGEETGGTQIGAEVSDQTVVAAPARTSPAIWIVGAIGGLALIASFLSLFGHQITSSFAPPATEQGTGETPVAGLAAPMSSDPVGMALLHDNVVTVHLTGVDAPPEGTEYEAWLTKGGSGLLSLGVVTVNNGEIDFTFTDSAGINLLADHDGFALSIEPYPDDDPAVSGDIAYSGYLSDEQNSRLGLLFDINREDTFNEMLIGGMKQQSLVYDSHLENTIAAIRTKSLSGAKSHGEHVINILVGRESPEYLDYNGNGRVENPGDSAGLINYLQVARDALLTVASQDENQASELNDLAAMIDSFLLTAEDAKNDELSITAADAIEEVVPLGEDLQTLKLQDAVTELANQIQSVNMAVGIEIFPTAK